MKMRSLLGFLGLLSVVACQQTKEVAPNQNVEALYERFHGKYKIIHSSSSEAIDANLDGKASTNMLAELSELSDALIEVRIYGKNQYNTELSFHFVHHWPKQDLNLHGFRIDPTEYDPSITAQFSTKVVSWSFAFDPAITKLILAPRPTPLPDPDIFTPPHRISIEAGDRIEVTLTKRLYTTAGWKTVQIVTVYERFTMTT